MQDSVIQSVETVIVESGAAPSVSKAQVQNHAVLKKSINVYRNYSKKTVRQHKNQ